MKKRNYLKGMKMYRLKHFMEIKNFIQEFKVVEEIESNLFNVKKNTTLVTAYPQI